jgi:hypothetical protein
MDKYLQPLQGYAKAIITIVDAGRQAGATDEQVIGLVAAFLLPDVDTTALQQATQTERKRIGELARLLLDQDTGNQYDFLRDLANGEV